MATAASVSNYAAVLKTIWPQSEIEDLFYKESPLFAMLPKDTSWTGEARVVAVQFGQTNGRSANYARAQANTNRSKMSKMTITTSDNFSIWQVEHKLMVLSRNEKGSIVKAIEQETKAAMKKFKRSLGYMVYGNGGGAIGQIASTVTLASTTLTFRSDVTMRQIDQGDWLTFSADDGTGGGGIRGGATRLEVTAVDPETRSVTVSANLNTVTGITVNDYVFIDGDYGAALYGVSAYVPTTAPSTAIWGMTRTTSKRRLGGIRVSGLTLQIHEAVKKALTVASKEGASISHIFMSPDDWLSLELTLGTQVRRGDEKVTAKVGFGFIEFTNPASSSSVKVFADADCPPGLVYGLDMSTWTLASAGEYPDILDTYGNKMDYLQAGVTAPTFEGRIGGYAQLYTDAPGYNFVLTLNA